MKPDRLNALTDGVVAIAITIVVLELPVPKQDDWDGIRVVLPVLSAYLLSFVNIGIFWNNHHHVLATAERVDGPTMWANLALLFFLSLIPFVIRWIDGAGFQPWPVAAYGIVLVGASLSYIALERAIVSRHGEHGTLARALGDDWKGKLSLLGYLAAVGLAFLSPPIAIGVYIVVALAWFAPDRRIEQQIVEENRGDHVSASRDESAKP